MEYKQYTYKGIKINVAKDDISNLRLIQSSKKYPLSTFFINGKKPNAIINCSYFTSEYVIGRNQGDLSQSTSSFTDKGWLGFALKDDLTYEAGKLDWWDVETSKCGFTPSTINVLDGQDVQLYTTEFNPSFDADMKQTRCESIFAILNDKKTCLLVTVESGLTGYQVVDYLKTFYDFDFLCCLDNGGSTEMIVDGDIKQKSLDGTERKMFNGLAFIASEPQKTEPSKEPEKQVVVKRTTNEGIETSPYWAAHPYNFDLVARPSLKDQCVWYVLGRMCERLGYPVANWDSDGFRDCSPNPAWDRYGADDAKNFLKKCNWVTSARPRVDSVIVLDGTYGHVAYIEEDLGDGKYGISQYNKLSDRKFHYEVVDLKGASKLYNMMILGYLYLPVIERDETKHQILFKVDDVRIRSNHDTNSEIVGLCAKGELFDVTEVFEDENYKWMNIGSGWVATTPDWVEEYLPIDIHAECKAEIAELKKTISYLKEQNNTLEIAYKEQEKTSELLDNKNNLLINKLNRIKDILEEE